MPIDHREDDVNIARDRSDQAYSLGRILSISDGVFAFALTLLVGQLVEPIGTKLEALVPQLLAQGPNYFS